MVPTIPACRWPGIAQKKVYSPGSPKKIRELAFSPASPTANPAKSVFGSSKSRVCGPAASSVSVIE